MAVPVFHTSQINLKEARIVMQGLPGLNESGMMPKSSLQLIANSQKVIRFYRSNLFQQVITASYYNKLLQHVITVSYKTRLLDNNESLIGGL